MRVGFLNNQIDNRGTGNALFDYADYNEKILGNESYPGFIGGREPNLQMLERLKKRFPLKLWTTYGDYFPDVDVLYHIKSGENDGFRVPEGVRYAVHAVFNYDPHGDRYAVVSPWMARIHGAAYIPHIINLPETTDDLRSTLAIGQDALVFGRHGGSDSFDIPFVWSAIDRALQKRSDIYFLFMNTNDPHITFYDNKRVIFIEPTADPYQKRVFINTCDAMIHARQRGETFGIAVGEFASLGKPVITYADSPERNHLEEVMCYTYSNEDELVWQLVDNEWLTEDKSEFWTGYDLYTPELVMAKFKEVFLD
jgi:hypothetical protein